MIKTIEIEQLSNKYGIAFIWKILVNGNLMISGIGDTWNDSFKEACEEFKKNYLKED